MPPARAAAAGKQGPALTQHLIHANQQLTPKEREWHAEQEKTKGNEHFRWGAGPCGRQRMLRRWRTAGGLIGC